jgi:transcription-repair coupling factor (superfamily II helicase)
MTLDNIAETTEALKGLKMVYPRDKFLELPVNVVSLYMDKAELAPVIYDVRTSLYDELCANFRENMEDIQHHLLNLIPSRKAELQEIAKADKAEQKRLAGRSLFAPAEGRSTAA